MEKLVHIIGFPIISKLIRGETVELSDVCFVPDDQLFNESKNKNFCVKFPIPQTSNTKELAATDSQQPLNAITLLNDVKNYLHHRLIGINLQNDKWALRILEQIDAVIAQQH